MPRRGSIGTVRGDARRIVVVGDALDDRESVDVLVSGRRLWSGTVEHAAARRYEVPVPAVLRSRLVGTAAVAVRRSATGETVAEGTVRFGGAGAQPDIQDDLGRPLTVNKWGSLVHTAESDAGLRRRLIESTVELLDVLGASGYRAYITGGTLLGAVRSGELLPHDDDADIGVFFEEGHPADLSARVYRLRRMLEEAGYTVVPHSTAHLQVIFDDADGGSSFYIDLFIAFYRDGVFNQPIAVHGAFDRSQLFPLRDIELGGRMVPSVADPEGWLELCYGPHWRTPDPAFVFETPPAVRRRFENWFGVFDLNRPFWEARFTEDPRVEAPHPDDLSAVLSSFPPGAEVLDLGCGSGGFARELSAHGFGVRAVDYSLRALELAAAAAPRADVRRANLADGVDVLGLIADVAHAERRAVLLADVLSGLVDGTRDHVYSLLRGVLRPGESAVASFPTELSASYAHERPDSWHLPLEWLVAETQPHGLHVETVSSRRRRTPLGPRNYSVVRLRRVETAHSDYATEGSS